ncbi:integrase core domain-containing protein [Bacillus sp. FJAT-26390]|uniref:integrase core domain-containing protein n=1 Tax=Bacillus sp. FJAT-26390 TaxID=1743142 RepID=UPI00350E34FE
MCEEFHIHHERIPPKSPNMNAYIESYHSQLERDLLQKNEYETFADAYEAIDRYLDFYNNRRLHRSIFMLSPTCFFQAWRQNQIQPMVIKL